MTGERVEEKPLQAALAVTSDRPSDDWLEPLYRRHAPALVRTAYRITGRLEDAEDVLQTVFLRLAGRARAPDLSDDPLPYLLRAATNAALDIVRSAKIRVTTSLGEAPGKASADPGPAPDRLQQSRELLERLRAAVAGLNPRHAEMFTLRYFEGLDNHRVAEILGTTPGTVAVTLHRVRARLLEDLRPLMGGRP
jgi:RNA polymerase sigma-70 factor (ECF subfamily)